MVLDCLHSINPKKYTSSDKRGQIEGINHYPQNCYQCAMIHSKRKYSIKSKMMLDGYKKIKTGGYVYVAEF